MIIRVENFSGFSHGLGSAGWFGKCAWCQMGGVIERTATHQVVREDKNGRISVVAVCEQHAKSSQEKMKGESK